MPSPSDLPVLERECERMYVELRGVGAFRRGTVNAVRHRFDKPNCVRADPSRPEHGEDCILTKKVAWKTVAAHYRPEPALDEAQQAVATHKRFRGLAQEVIEVNEKICESRPVSPVAADQPSGEGNTRAQSRRSEPPSRSS